MDMEDYISLMVLDMKENLKMIKLKDMGEFIILMIYYMKVNLKII